MMTNDELMAESCKKKVDRIILISDDIFRFIRQMTEYFRVGPWNVDRIADENGETNYLEAILPTVNGFDIQVVEPVADDSIYAKFYHRYGKGIMGMRERVSDARWAELEERFREKNIATVKTDSDNVMYVDVMDEIGAVMGYVRQTYPVQPAEGGRLNLCQICLVTDDILKLAHLMVEYFDVGPWEIGKANNRTFTDLECGGYGTGKIPDADFLVGIGTYGQIQVELIEPKSGPVPYFGFLNRRGPGFHHIKQNLTKAEYEESISRIREMGLKPALAGKICGCPWCNWATEDMFGFVFEMNDDSTFEALPDGYDPYFVQ